MNDWITKAEKLTELYMHEIEGLTHEQINWKPDIHTWSIAEVVVHVLKVNESYTPIFDKILTDQLSLPWFSKLPFMPNLFGRLILKASSPANGKKVKTFPIWQPEHHPVIFDVQSAIAHQTVEFKEIIHGLESSKKLSRIMHSPANSSIFYSVEYAFNIILSHQERHLIQIRQLKEIMPVFES